MTTGWTNYLTLREQEILQLVMRGYRNQDIANELRCSIETVKCHLARVFNKKGMASRTELAMAAVAHPEWFARVCPKCNRPLDDEAAAGG